MPGLSTLARFAFIAGEIANGAQAVADIVENPEFAPLMGAAGKPGKLEKTLGDASTARKVLTDASAMGKEFKEIDDKMQTVMAPGSCTLLIRSTGATRTLRLLKQHTELNIVWVAVCIQSFELGVGVA